MNGIGNLWFLFSLWDAFNLKVRSFSNFSLFDRKQKIIWTLFLVLGIAFLTVSLALPHAFAILKKAHCEGLDNDHGLISGDSC